MVTEFFLLLFRSRSRNIYFLKFSLFGNAEIVTLGLDYEHLVTYQREIAKNKLN